MQVLFDDSSGGESRGPLSEGDQFSCAVVLAVILGVLGSFAALAWALSGFSGG